jgi:hypothetical protein
MLSEMSRSTVPSKRSADADEDRWVADEDRFVLQQAKKKAAIRVKGGRAQPVDWLAVALVVLDPERNPLDDEVDDGDLDLVDPQGVFEGLQDAQLAELEKGIDTYLALESSRSNQEYWNVSWQSRMRCAATDADRPADDENNLPRSKEEWRRLTAVRTGCRIRRLGPRQTSRTEDLAGVGEAGKADQDKIVV